MDRLRNSGLNNKSWTNEVYENVEFHKVIKDFIPQRHRNKLIWFVFHLLIPKQNREQHITLHIQNKDTSIR